MRALLYAGAALFLACGRAPATNQGPAADRSGIEIHATSEVLTAGGKPVSLSAVAGTEDAAISWKLSGPGSLSDSSGASIIYFPPACVVSKAQALITASAGAASATLALSVSPAAAQLSCLQVTASTEEITVGAPAVKLTALVAGGDASAVTWSLFGGGSLSASTGAATEYTPKPETPFDATVTVTAALGDLRAHARIVVHPRPRYPVGSCPGSLAFDGTSMWVSNKWPSATTPGSVMKLRPEDGAILATIPLSRPGDLLFDGTYVWVTSIVELPGPLHNLVLTKLRPSDAATLGTFTVWYAPSGRRVEASSTIAFDGESLWILVYDGVAKVRASDGAVVAVFPAQGASAVAWDGSSVWVASAGALTQLRTDATVQGRIWFTRGVYVMTMIGPTLWVNTADTPGALVSIDPRTQIVLDSRATPGIPTLAFDGTNLWTGGNPVRKLRTSDLSVLAEYTLPAYPTAVAFEGARVWVAACTYPGINVIDAVFKL